MMLKRGIDVTELVNSQLFYPIIWQNYSLYSSDKEKVLLPYNNELEELEHEDPFSLFQEEQDSEPKQTSTDKRRQSLKRSILITKSIEEEQKEEQYEMQYHYIFMEAIEGGQKIDVARTLKDCEDIRIFEQEAIQNIIDYKWETYAREFFF